MSLFHQKIQKQAMAFNLTTSIRRIYDLMDKLTQNSVTPAGLEDILSDWL